MGWSDTTKVITVTINNLGQSMFTISQLNLYAPQLLMIICSVFYLQLLKETKHLVQRYQDSFHLPHNPESFYEILNRLRLSKKFHS